MNSLTDASLTLLRTPQRLVVSEDFVLATILSLSAGVVGGGRQAALCGAFLGGQPKEAPWDNPWLVEQGKRDLIHCVSLLEDHLSANGPFMIGGKFTLADIPVGLAINRWFMLDNLKRPEFPAVSSYYEGLRERPAFRAHGRNGLP